MKPYGMMIRGRGCSCCGPNMHKSDVPHKRHTESRDYILRSHKKCERRKNTIRESDD